MFVGRELIQTDNNKIYKLQIKAYEELINKDYEKAIDIFKQILSIAQSSNDV
jgi:hypothetical protein